MAKSQQSPQENPVKEWPGFCWLNDSMTRLLNTHDVLMNISYVFIKAGFLVTQARF
ncbi:hypothetical protein [Halovibrio variabilis]|uniref:hypothetical protein n=1 Tax=Halovibrio variabilis TaxID=31910 RepID=UPI001478F9E6|nr:hypothetical protein [Halovibrio variabilis]